MALDIDQIKDNYSNMDDFKLERIAQYDTWSFPPEIHQVIISEIKKRGLDKSLLTKIEAQTKAIMDGEVFNLIDKIRGLPCPTCNS